MFTQTLKRVWQVQFIRQILGAVGGALVALACYTAYRGAHDAVRAYLIPPGADRAAYTGEVRVNDASTDNMDRIAARAARIAQRLGENRQAVLRAEARRDSALPAVSAASSSASSVAAVPAQLRQAPSARAVPAEAAMHAGAPSLPNSGIALWAAGFAALCVSLLSVRRVRMLLLPARKLVD